MGVTIKANPDCFYGCFFDYKQTDAVAFTYFWLRQLGFSSPLPFREALG